MILLDQRRDAEAEAVLAAAVEHFGERRRGSQGLDALSAAAAHGLALARRGRLDDGEARIRAVLTAMAAQDVADHSRYGLAALHLVAVLTGSDRPDEAEHWRGLAAANLTANLGEDDPRLQRLLRGELRW